MDNNNIIYDNFYSILFDKKDDTCVVGRSLQQVLKEQFRQKLQESYRSHDAHKNLVRAYNILSNPNLRKEYDFNKQYTINLAVYLKSTQRKAEEGDFEGVCRDFEIEHINPNDTDENGHTPLYVACRANQKKIVEWILDHGGDPDVPQKGGSTSMHVTCFYGHVEIAQVLLKYGANVSRSNKCGNVPLDEVYLKVKKSMSSIIKSHTKTPWGRVQSHIEGNTEDFNLLIKELSEHLGNNIDRVFYYGQTLLMCAAKNGKNSILIWLLKCGANPNATDMNLRTALHLAAMNDKPNSVRILLDHKANPHALDYWENAPSYNCSKQVYEQFTLTIPGINQLQLYISDDTKYDMFKYYLRDSDLDVQYENGKTLLYSAAQVGNLNLVKLLIQRGANATIRHISGSTPLHGATYAGHIDVVKYLVGFINPFIKNNLGKTCIEELETNQSVDPEKKKQLKNFFDKYRYMTSDVRIPINLVNDEGILLTKSPMLMYTTNKMVQLVKKIEPEWNEFRQDQREHQRWDIYNPLPYHFSFGDKRLTIEPSGSFLDAIIKVSHSPIPFLDFPITIKYWPVPDETLKRLEKVSGGEFDKVEGISTSNHRLQQLCVFLTRDTITKASFITNGYERKITVNCKGTKYEKYFDQFVFTFPAGLGAENTIFINEKIIEGTDYPTFEFKPERAFTQYELQEKPSVLAITKPLYQNYSIYTFYPSNNSWIEIQSQKEVGSIKKTAMIIPHMNTLVTIIPKLEIIPMRNIRNPSGTFVHQPGFYCFNEMLSKTIDTSNPEDIKIHFVLPDEAVQYPKKYFTAYHGTTIGFVESIVMNGLLKPKSITGTGNTIEILQGHIKNAAESKLDWVRTINGFESAIFLSPSFNYSSLEIYAKPFAFINTYKGDTKPKYHNAILECLVLKGSGPDTYQEFPATTINYSLRPDDDPRKMEIRVVNPDIICVKCLHIISQKYVHLR